MSIRVLSMQKIDVGSANHGYILLLTPYVTWNYSRPHIYLTYKYSISVLDVGVNLLSYVTVSEM